MTDVLIKWTVYDTIVSYLTTELNSLANAALVVGAAIDFTAATPTYKQYLDVEVLLASVNLSAQVNPYIALWLLARTDGTNYEDGSASVIPARPPDKILPVIASSAAHRLFARFALTNPDYAMILIQNKTGAAFASSGNTLKYYTYGERLV